MVTTVTEILTVLSHHPKLHFTWPIPWETMKKKQKVQMMMMIDQVQEEWVLRWRELVMT